MLLLQSLSLLSLLGLCLASSNCPSINSQLWAGQKASLSDEELGVLMSSSNTSKFRQFLDPILRVRRVDTPEHDEVRDFIVESMRSLGWTTELHTFSGDTPYGKKRFANIISTQYVYAVRRFVIACHYDSKWDPVGFVGAIDSAVPCAMMIDLAAALNNTLWRSKWRFEDADFSLQFMFFDGEEAFRTWSATDSLYGARSLADKLAGELYQLPSDYAISGTSQQCQSQRELRQIDRLSTLMLLDLIGTRDTRFANQFPATGSIYSQLVEIESDLRSRGLLSARATAQLFNTGQAYGPIEDDHIPFLRRNVPIVHLISVPFPTVWHKLEDNAANLDWPTIDNVNRILRVFVCRYFGLNSSRKTISSVTA